MSQKEQEKEKISFFARYLTVWVFLCMGGGMILGQLFPALFQFLGKIELAHVNLPVGVLIWAMIIPMLMKVDFSALHEVKKHLRGIGVTVTTNWLIKPFSMALLAWLFVRVLFAPYLPEDQINSYVAGLIILAAAPCTAMVFVWSNLCKGDPHFTLSQVVLNDTIMVFAFAPIVGLLLGISSLTVPWGTLVLSVVVYIVIPLSIAQGARGVLLKKGEKSNPKYEKTLKVLGECSLLSLLVTLVLLFGFQGEEILNQPLVIFLLSVPIIIQVYFTSSLTYIANRALGVDFSVAGPSALIGASNFFELAVAVAIGLYGFHSGAALATVVGVLVEVPVMLSVVAIVNKTQTWYEKNKK